MTTTAQNFTMWSGDDKTITVTLSTDITGATINYAIAANVGSTALITKATGGSGIAITDAANGIFTIDLDPSDTSRKAGDIDFHVFWMPLSSDGALVAV